MVYRPGQVIILPTTVRLGHHAGPHVGPGLGDGLLLVQVGGVEGGGGEERLGGHQLETTGSGIKRSGGDLKSNELQTNRDSPLNGSMTVIITWKIIDLRVAF